MTLKQISFNTQTHIKLGGVILLFPGLFNNFLSIALFVYCRMAKLLCLMDRNGCGRMQQALP